MPIEITRLTQLTLAFTSIGLVHLISFHPSIAQPRDRQQEVVFGENACEAYAWGYAVAQTRRHYIEICGSKGGKILSFYAIDRQSADPEKTKIQIDNVSRQNNSFIATSGSDRYTLNRDFLTLKRNGKLIFKERVSKYKKLS